MHAVPSPTKNSRAPRHACWRAVLRVAAMPGRVRRRRPSTGCAAAEPTADSWAWRLIMVVLALFGGAGVLLYVLLWIFVPSE
jgi:hypothetical protein